MFMSTQQPRNYRIRPWCKLAHPVGQRTPQSDLTISAVGPIRTGNVGWVY
jgi:hypothetical protein